MKWISPGPQPKQQTQSDEILYALIAKTERDALSRPRIEL